MKKLLALIAVCMIMLSCSKNKTEEVLIRVQNDLNKEVQDIIIYTTGYDGSYETSYGSLFAGEASGYKRHKEAVNIPLYKCMIPGLGLVEQSAICGNGLAMLEPGNYSLVIYTDINGSITTRFDKN